MQLGVFVKYQRTLRDAFSLESEKSRGALIALGAVECAVVEGLDRWIDALGDEVEELVSDGVVDVEGGD